MNGTQAVRALVTATWQQRFNRQWRFSKVRSGFWLLLIQAGLATVAIYRLKPGGSVLPALSLLLLMAAQAGFWSLLMVLGAGRNRLYGARELTLLHLTPAPSWTVLLALVLADLPGRLLSMLIWAASLSLMAPAADRIWLLPSLWLLGLLAGSVGQLAGLTLLIAWVRAWPHFLPALNTAIMGVQIAVFYYALYLLAAGLPAGELGAATSRMRWPIGVAMALLLGLPGLLLLLRLWRSPARISEAYRESWLQLTEAGDGAPEYHRRFWPAILPKAVGALQAREWLVAARNPFTHFRLAVFGLLVAGVVSTGPAMARLAGGREPRLLLALGVGAAWFVFGEMAAAAFTSEGGRLALSGIAGVRPGRLLLGKLGACAPFALATAGLTWLVAWRVGIPAAGQVILALKGGWVGLGMLTTMVAMGALDATYQEPEELPDGPGLLAAGLEQIPRGSFSVAGLVAAGAYGAGSIWWSGPPATLLLSAIPLLALLAGYYRLHRLLTHAR